MNIIRWIVAVSILNVFVFAGTLAAGFYLQNINKSEPKQIAVVMPQVSSTPKSRTKPIEKTQISTPEEIQPTSEPPPPEPTKDPRCVISVDGASYDVTSFRSAHSGGDIFTCGTDMSAVFHGQHAASYLSQMAQYKL